jgi:hypothetical protein
VQHTPFEALCIGAFTIVQITRRRIIARLAADGRQQRWSILATVFPGPTDIPWQRADKLERH